MDREGVREVVTRKRMMIFSGTTHPVLAEEIAEHLGIGLSEARIITRALAQGWVLVMADTCATTLESPPAAIEKKWKLSAARVNLRGLRNYRLVFLMLAVAVGVGVDGRCRSAGSGHAQLVRVCGVARIAHDEGNESRIARRRRQADRDRVNARFRNFADRDARTIEV